MAPWRGRTIPLLDLKGGGTSEVIIKSFTGLKLRIPTIAARQSN
jgi:hypothetical protein